MKTRDVLPQYGEEVAKDITEAFKLRPWHQNVLCKWDGEWLVLTAENDYDPQGLALMDELSDEYCANVGRSMQDPDDRGEMIVLSITQISS